jgi:hypothetical protein
LYELTAEGDDATSTSHLCRWSEIAEARQFYQAAMFDQPLTVTNERHPRLGELITKFPSCFRRAVKRELACGRRSEVA